VLTDDIITNYKYFSSKTNLSLKKFDKKNKIKYNDKVRKFYQ
jgi:hypothetical protein